MGVSGQNLNLTEYDGEITITNCLDTNSDNHITGSGTIILDSTITEGKFSFFGDINIINNAGANIVVEDFTTSAQVWKEGKALTLGKFLGLK